MVWLQALLQKGSKQKDKGCVANERQDESKCCLGDQNGVTKLVNVKNQDAVTKVIDMAPDLINRFLGGKPAVSEETVGIAKETAASYEGKKA